MLHASDKGSEAILSWKPKLGSSLRPARSTLHGVRGGTQLRGKTGRERQHPQLQPSQTYSTHMRWALGSQGLRATFSRR